MVTLMHTWKWSRRTQMPKRSWHDVMGFLYGTRIPTLQEGRLKSDYTYAYPHTPSRPWCSKANGFRIPFMIFSAHRSGNLAFPLFPSHRILCDSLRINEPDRDSSSILESTNWVWISAAPCSGCMILGKPFTSVKFFIVIKNSEVICGDWTR